jgi:hypothetical protein
MQQITLRLAEDNEYGKAGSVVRLALYPGDVTISEEMDTFLVAFSPPEFRADDVCPIQLVDKDTGKYRIFGLNNAFRAVNVLSSIQADIPEVDVDTTLADYAVQERALGGFVPTVTEINAAAGSSSWDPRTALARRIGWALALDREIRVWTMLKTAASWNANNRATISAGAEWNDIENGDPMLDIMDRIQASAQPVTDIWVNPPVAHAMLRSKAVREHMRTLAGDSQLPAQIAQATATQRQMDFQIPGLPPIHVVGSKVLNETTGVPDWILDDTVILTSRGGGGAVGDEIMTCKTFRRRGPSGTGFTTREFPLDRRGLHGGTFMASGHAEQVVMVAGTVGGAIYDVLQ